MAGAFRLIPSSLLCFLPTLAFSHPQGNLNTVCDANAVTAKVNDVELTLAIDSTLKSYVILNPESAKKAGLKKSSFSSAETYVRDKIIKGNVTKARLHINERKGKTRVVWFERNYIHGSQYDGVIGISELGTSSVKLENCNHTKNSNEEFYLVKSIPITYENNRVLIDSVLPDKLKVMLDFNRSNTQIGSDAYGYMLSQAMLTKLNEYAYQELEFGYYLPSRRVLLQSPVLEGVVIDSENAFTPVGAQQMVDDQSGAVNGKAVDTTEELVVYGYKEDEDAKFKSFIKLGTKSVANCRSVVFDLKKRLAHFSCIKNE